jgi:hypothetical protein
MIVSTYNVINGILESRYGKNDKERNCSRQPRQGRDYWNELFAPSFSLPSSQKRGVMKKRKNQSN